MDRLTRITIHGAGFKGRPFDQPLTGADLFVGPNGSGKSSRLLAIAAIRSGLAETPTDPTREYLGPTRPAAEGVLLFEGGAEVRRDLSKGKGKDAERSSLEGERLMGGHVVRWDLADFARATDKDRASLLERVCNAAGAAGTWTGTKADAFLRKQMGIDRGAGLAGDHPLNLALSSWSSGKPVGTWLAERAKWMDDIFTAANAAQKLATNAAAEASKHLDDVEIPAGTLAAKRAELAQVKAQGEQIKADIAAAEASQARGDLASMETASRAVVDAEQAVTGAAEAVRVAQAAAERGPDGAAVTRAKAELVEARAKVLALPDPATLADAVAQAEADLQAKEAALASAVTRADKAAAAHRRESEALAALDGGIGALSSLLSDAAGNCRHCDGEDPLGLGLRLETEQARRAELVEAVASASSVLEPRRQLVNTARDAERAASRALQTAKQTAASGASTRAAAVQAVATAETVVRREEAAVAFAAGVLAAAVTKAEAAQAAAAETLTAARTALDAIEARAAESSQGGGALVDVGLLQETREGLLADYKRLTAEVELFVAQEVHLKNHQEAVAKREAATAHFEIVKLLKKGLNELRATVAAEAYGPIQSAADEILREAGIDMQVEFRDESDFGAVCRQRDGSRPYVAFWALSDAQRAEFGAAVAVALAKLTKSPWPAVVLDGMEKIESAHLLGILRAVGAMVERGELANFVGAYMAESAPTWADTGVTVHWLGEAVAQAA